jgi:hypothetical protein
MNYELKNILANVQQMQAENVDKMTFFVDCQRTKFLDDYSYNIDVAIFDEDNEMTSFKFGSTNSVKENMKEFARLKIFLA